MRKLLTRFMHIPGLIASRRRSPSFITGLGVAMASFTLVIMGLFIQSNLVLELDSNQLARLRLHLDAQVWQCQNLLDQGVSLASAVPATSSRAFSTEPSLELVVFRQEDSSLLFTRGRQTGFRLPGFVFQQSGLTGEEISKDSPGSRMARIWRVLTVPGGHRNAGMLFVYRVHEDDKVFASTSRFALVTGLVLAGFGALALLLVPLFLPALNGGGVWPGRIFSYWNNFRGLILIFCILTTFSLILAFGYGNGVAQSELETARYQLGTLAPVVQSLQSVEPDIKVWGGVEDLLQGVLSTQKSRHWFYLRDEGRTVIWAASMDWQGQYVLKPGNGDQIRFFGLPLVENHGFEIALPGHGGPGLVAGVIPDQETIRRGWLAALMDLLSLMAVAFMACIELFRPLLSRVRPETRVPEDAGNPGRSMAPANPDRPVRSAAPELKAGPAVLQGIPGQDRRSNGPRFMIFLLFTALFLPVAGFPGQVIDWLKHSPAANPGWWLALTVCSWLFGVAMVTLSSRWLTRILGFEGLALASIGLCMVAFLLNLLMPHLVLMILLRVASGFAHGCMAMLTCNNDGLGGKSETLSGRTRVMDIRDWNAAFASGAIVGIGTGGILSVHNGLGMSLGIGAGLLLVVLGYFRYKRPFRLFVPSVAGISTVFIRGLDKAKFLRFCLILFTVMLPLQLATQGLFYFLFPLYMTTIGMGYADIARVLIGYGLIGLLTPLWKRMVQGYRQERMFIISSHLICGISIMALALQGNLGAMMLAVLAMGVAAMLNDGISYRMVLKQPGMLDVGEDPEPWYRLAEMMSAVLVPLVGAGLALLAGVRHAILIIGILSLAGSVAFTFFADYGKRGQAWK